MSSNMSDDFSPAKLIEEMKKHPGLYKVDHPADRTEKLYLWKEVGAAMYSDWESYNKATAYDKVLKLQRKWRSLRDAYNRELRARRKKGSNPHRKVYKFFKRMSFLGGYSGTVSEEESPSPTPEYLEDTIDENYLEVPLEAEEEEEQPRRIRKKQRRRRSTDSMAAPEEMEMPVFPIEMANDENDSDRLFMLSFLPEMRQLPGNLKMWVRAQIANAMQEAVHCHYTNTQPSTEKNYGDLKKSRYETD